MTEDERIARIVAILGAQGIGHDGAVLGSPAAPLVWTIDEQVEDVHFRRAWCSMRDVGFRATMAAASDLAAMGAEPLGALAAIVVPADVREEDLDEIAHGQREACDAIGAAIMGGNLSAGEHLSIATTWLGTTAHAVLRTGARPGDGLWVCGHVGLASAGVRALERGLSNVPAEALRAWRRPSARIAEGLRMAQSASAAIDVSDGLARDAGHVASMSHVRIVIDEAPLRGLLVPATETVAKALAIDPIDLALGGGEDYALLCTSPRPIGGFVRIGEVTAGDGVFLRSQAGDERPVTDGWDHFG